MFFVQITEVKGIIKIYSIQNYHNPFNVIDDFLDQNMVVFYHNMFHTSMNNSILIEQIMSKRVYPLVLHFA